MKNKTIQTVSPYRKSLLWGIFLACGLIFSSYKVSACTASFTYSAGLNGHYTFTSTGAGPNYTWNAGDGSGWSWGGITFNHTYLANGTYTVELAISDSSLGCYDTARTIITVSNVTSPCILSAGYNYAVGNYGVVNFTSTSTGTVSYTQYYWKPGDSNQVICGGPTFSHQYAHPGNYFPWLVLIDTGSAYCIDSIQEYVNVTSIDTNYCHIHAHFTYTTGSYGEVTFTNTSTGTSPGDLYTWIMGDTTNNYNGMGPFNHTYAFDGTYSVTLFVRSDTFSSGCYDSITIPVTITNACNMQASFTYAYDSNGGIKFTSTSSGVNAGTIYKWTFGDSTPTVTGGDTITHGYPFLGYYTVTLFDSNASGCNSSYTKTIYIYNKDSLQACFTYTADSLNAGQYDFTSSCSRGTYAYTYYKWTPGDGNLPDSGLGMTTYQHTYFSNGPYSATLTIWYTILPHRAGSSPRYDLSSYTLTVNVTTNPTGIQSMTDTKIYNVYPNPNNGSFKIDVTGLANEKNAEIRISNMMGQVIYQSNATLNGGNTLSNISLPDAANGVYLLQIITNDNTYTSRIAIQK